MNLFFKINIILRKFSVCIGVIWLGGRFIPEILSSYISISILSDWHVFACSMFLFGFLKITNKIFKRYESF